MEIIVEHGTKEEGEAQINRLKKYYELLYKMKEMSLSDGTLWEVQTALCFR